MSTNSSFQEKNFQRAIIAGGFVLGMLAILFFAFLFSRQIIPLPSEAGIFWFVLIGILVGAPLSGAIVGFFIGELWQYHINKKNRILFEPAELSKDTELDLEMRVDEATDLVHPHPQKDLRKVNIGRQTTEEEIPLEWRSDTKRDSSKELKFMILGTGSTRSGQELQEFNQSKETNLVMH